MSKILFFNDLTLGDVLAAAVLDDPQSDPIFHAKIHSVETAVCAMAQAFADGAEDKGNAAVVKAPKTCEAELQVALTCDTRLKGKEATFLAALAYTTMECKMLGLGEGIK